MANQKMVELFHSEYPREIQGDNFLQHHGILGMKWGVRRYQNSDGTLTSAGKKRYGSGKGERIYKDFKKSIRKQRGELHGTANRWMTNTYIGENSRRLIDDNREKRKEYKNSEEYKAWDKKVKAFNTKYERMDFVPDDYDSKWEKLMKERPKKDFADIYDGGVSYSNEGRKYLGDYLNGAGANLSVAYIKDLGFNDRTAKQLVKELIKSNRSLGLI